MEGQPAAVTARTPLRAVAPVSLGLLLVGLVATGAASLLAAPTGTVPLSVPWWALAVLFAAGQSVALNIQAGREARSVSVTELPFVIGLLLLSPAMFLLARVVGCVVGQGVGRGQWRRPLKLAFNTSVVLAEAPLGLVVFRLLAHGGAITSPQAWAAAIVAATLVSFTGGGAVSVVIARLEGDAVGVSLVRAVVRTSAPQAVAFGIVGLVAVLAIETNPWAVVPLVLLTVGCVVIYHAYAGFVERHENTQRLHQFSQAVSAQTDPERIVSGMLEQVCGMLHADAACLTFLSGPGQDTEAVLRPGGPLEHRPARYLTRDTGWLVDHLADGHPLLFARDTKDVAARHWLAALGLHEAMMVPLRSEQGSTAILIVVDRRGDMRGFNHADLQLLETVANHGSTALRHGELVSQLRHDSLHDSLTGVPNRTFFQQELERLFAALDQGGRPFAVAMVDLDAFKEVNDTLGHDHGDRLLQEVAARFSSVIGERGVLCRFGGDEFTIVFPDCDDEVAAVRRCGVVLDALTRPVVIDGMALDVSASIGVAMAPLQAADAAELLKRADVAMYVAKQERGSVVVYDAEHDTCSPSRLALAAALRQAIADRSLTVFVQPQTSLSSGAVVCVEALARWIDPERGFVPPDEFIPVAERTGLIGPLTDLVLDKAIGACAGWQGRAPGVGVAVNLSARSLRDDSLDEQVGRLLRRHRLPARLLTLEITETSAMSDPTRTARVLDRLRGRGIRLSIDDFGTGYSSLAYLRRLPVQEVKVDRSFVQRMDVEAEDAAIVRSILELARALELEVVAEGVETGATLQLLRDLGCDLAQGYYVSRPMPVEEFADWVTEWSRGTSTGVRLAAVAEA